MKFKKRLAVLEQNAHHLNYLPPINIHTIVKQSKGGPKEVKPFAQLQTNDVCHTMERKAHETQRQFENRIKYILNFEKKHSLQKS